jgi:hypothetical protein
LYLFIFIFPYRIIVRDGFGLNTNHFSNRAEQLCQRALRLLQVIFGIAGPGPYEITAGAEPAYRVDSVDV